MSSYLYRAFVDLLEGEDEDTDATDYDLDLQAAITASMQDSSKYEQHEINIYMHSQCKFALTSRPKRLDTAEVQSIIRQHRDQVLPKLEFLEDNREKVNRIDVRRSHIWSDTVEAFTRSTFSSQKWLRVHFVLEEAANEGGPRREFFRLAVRQCSQSDLFVGQPSCRTMALSVAAIHKKKYLVAGTRDLEISDFN
jgi:hypothetical protein